MCVSNEQERAIAAFLMQFAGLERVTAVIFRQRIERFNANHGVQLSAQQFMDDGYIVFHAHDERCAGANAFMNDGYYELTDKAKRTIRK